MGNRYNLTEAEYEGAYAAFLAAIAKLDGQGPFANVCRCTQGNISQLVTRRSLLPARFVLKVEAATEIPRHHLRPDIYAPADTDLVADCHDVVACYRQSVSQRAARR